ncbi:MAG: hypothetical protein GY899_07075 [Verrucomicrobiaceae bacterium]|nr:hypothetical protein [Verrucomicrobiaceae bacterium]
MRRKPFIAVIACVLLAIVIALFMLQEKPKVAKKKQILIEPLPSNGVVTYSEGDTDHRTLQLRRIRKGILQEARLVTPKGSGGDIMGVISFDGRWLAFARNVAPAGPGATINGQWKGFENEDYHKFHAWDIHVVRIDGELPAQSIRVAHGYWPSWGEDSSATEKTLYFSNYEEGAVYAVQIHDEESKVGKPYLHARVEAWTGEDHHMQVAPDGRKVAIRINGEMHIKGLNGNAEDQLLRKGCHPSWMADSKWLFLASSKFWHVENGRRSGSQGGKYHFGSSSNMKWAVSITGFEGNRQNCGFNLCLYPMGPVKGKLTMHMNYAQKISGKGSWPDVHEFAEVDVSHAPDRG